MNIRQSVRAVRERGPIRLPILGMLLAIAGCVEIPPQPTITADDTTWVLSGAGSMSLATAATPIESPPALLHVTDDMRRFAEDATRDRGSLARKTAALAAAISDPNGLNLHYDAQATLTAEQAFREHRANCLSYTLLFVALAREAGIPAEFNEVDIPPIWDLGGNGTLILYKHVNAKIELGEPFSQIVDISRSDYAAHYTQRVIADDLALAQFYNNRAAELRQQRQDSEALRYQLRALQLAPETAYLWTNLAELYLQSGNLRAARIAVTRALSLDSTDMMSCSAAAEIYERLGEDRIAAFFHQRTRQFLEENPYYHYQLALAALDQHRDRLAYDETVQAIRLYPKDPRFFFLAAVLLDRFGKTRLARDSIEAALMLSPDGDERQRYRNKFERLTQHG